MWNVRCFCGSLVSVTLFLEFKRNGNLLLTDAAMLYIVIKRLDVLLSKLEYQMSYR